MMLLPCCRAEAVGKDLALYGGDLEKKKLRKELIKDGCRRVGLYFQLSP